MQLEKRQLANGNIIVWMDDHTRVIHHQNGLTIGLTEQEAQELKAWLDRQDATAIERDEYLAYQRAAQTGEARPCQCAECRWERARAHDNGETYTDHNGYVG